MLLATWAEALGNDPMPIIWKKDHQVLADKPHAWDPLNDDLKCFFNSLPQDGILQDVEFLISEFA